MPPCEKGVGPLTPDDFIQEACRLATESVVNGWGGPFGAVIVKDGQIVAKGQNRVLLTGDVTAHAEVEAIRKACQMVNPHAPSIATDHVNEAHLALVPRPEGSSDPVPARARMLLGMEIYTSAAPCPMCMGAIYSARIDAVHFACGGEQTRQIGFDDAAQYEDLARPVGERRIRFTQLRPDLGAVPYQTWDQRPNKHPY